MSEFEARPRFPRSSTAPNHGRTPEQIADAIAKITSTLAKRARHELPWDGSSQRQFGDITVVFDQEDTTQPSLEIWREPRGGREMRRFSSIWGYEDGHLERTLMVTRFPSDDGIQNELVISAGETLSRYTRIHRPTYRRDNAPVIRADIADHAADILNMMRVGVNDAIAISQQGQKEKIHNFIIGSKTENGE